MFLNSTQEPDMMITPKLIQGTWECEGPKHFLLTFLFLIFLRVVYEQFYSSARPFTPFFFKKNFDTEKSLELKHKSPLLVLHFLYTAYKMTLGCNVHCWNGDKKSICVSSLITACKQSVYQTKLWIYPQ